MGEEVGWGNWSGKFYICQGKVREFQDPVAVAAIIELWCARKTWRILKKLELLLGIASSKSYAFFLLSKLPPCTITHAKFI